MSSQILTLPPGLTWEYTRTATFATKKQKSVAGIEITAAFQPYSLSRWSLSIEVLRQVASFTELATLQQFFVARQGAFDTFLFDAMGDDVVTKQAFGTGNGSATAFQLTSSLDEPIYNPYASPAPEIYVNNVLKTVSTDYTLSGGTVTFTSAPTNTYPLTWTGQYYYRVRFLNDSLDFGAIATGLWDSKKLVLVQVLGS